MKWKSKHRDGEIGTALAIAIEEYVPDWQKYFEPVYEVGDWVTCQDPSEFEDINEACPVGSTNQVKGFKSGCFIFDSTRKQPSVKRFRPATPEEIEKATKKFPFEYESLSRIISYRVDDDTEKRDCVWFYENRSGPNGYCLTESAWQEIGKRKGWNLE